MTRWFIPNPASVAPEVLAAQVTPPGIGTMLQPSVLSERVREFFFPSAQPPAFLCCTREGLLQMSVEWFLDRNILMIVNGPMSQEWYDIADDCHAAVTIFDSAYGTDIDLNAFHIALQKEKFDILMFADTDVYMGNRINAEVICAEFRRMSPDGLIVADISGSVFCSTGTGDPIGSDICLCASEMALGIPPGLGMVILNERAHTRALAHNMMNGRYFNYPRRTVSPSPSALDVPVYPLLNALNEQIDLILTEGMPERIRRMSEVCAFIHRWAAEHDFPILASPGSRALNSTAIQLPVGISAAEMAEEISRYGVFVMPGVGLMPKNTLIIYHGNDTKAGDATVLTRVLDRFLNDYDTRRKHGPHMQVPQEQKV